MRGFKDGKQKKVKPNSEPKKTKQKVRRKIHFEESESGLPTDIDGNELHDDVSSDGNYLIKTNVCPILRES
jgi:hypothetical protein